MNLSAGHRQYHDWTGRSAFLVPFQVATRVQEDHEHGSAQALRSVLFLRVEVEAILQDQIVPLNADPDVSGRGVSQRYPTVVIAQSKDLVLGQDESTQKVISGVFIKVPHFQHQGLASVRLFQDELGPEIPFWIQRLGQDLRLSLCSLVLEHDVRVGRVLSKQVDVTGLQVSCFFDEDPDEHHCLVKVNRTLEDG